MIMILAAIGLVTVVLWLLTFGLAVWVCIAHRRLVRRDREAQRSAEREAIDRLIAESGGKAIR